MAETLSDIVLQKLKELNEIGHENGDEGRVLEI